MIETLIISYSVILAILSAHRDKLAIDGNLKDRWHQLGFAIRFWAVGGLVFGMLFLDPMNFWEFAYLIIVGGVTFWTVFDPYLNHLRGKELNHLGSNPLDELLKYPRDQFSLDPLVVKSVLLLLIIGVKLLTRHL